MNTKDLHYLRKWRPLLIAIALVIALAGSIFPGALRPAWAAEAGAPAAQSLQDAPIPAPAAVSKGRFRYFPQTGHFLHGLFFAYWETHGATPVLGLPITEPIVEDGLTVQYLERARLEWHPEITGDAKKQVLLTRLGAITTQENGRLFERLDGGSDTAASHFFEETGHTLSNAFFTYWLRNGGLAVFGYPISEEIVETNQDDGRLYTVQYFERNRFEWHPKNPPTSNVQLGLLGIEYARAHNLNPLARILLPTYITNDEDLTDSPRLRDLVDADLLPAVQALGRTPQFRWVPALIVQNKIFVEFSAIDEEGVAGAFVATYSKSRPYVIVVPESERHASVEALASVLAHEATHAYDTISGVIDPRSSCSVEEEVRAYLNGLGAWLVLQGEDALQRKYKAGSLDADINHSLRGFNSGSTGLDLDFNLPSARAFLEVLYGLDCGK